MKTKSNLAGQAGVGATVGYLPGRFAGFFLRFGTCGDGGVSSIRRTIRSNAGDGKSLFDFAAMVGV